MVTMGNAICGTLGDRRSAWRRVLALPFELAALPRTWFGAIGLPVVSYALPALIAIGHACFFHAPPGVWNPLRLLRRALWGRIYPMLRTLQPSSGGYLEATPLTSFVTMALASSGDKDHPCVPHAVEFLLKSEREDGSWPIDTNLATWGTTLAVKALLGGVERKECGKEQEYEQEQEQELRALRAEMRPVKEWLLGQQYREVHPFTNAAPGGWAWTDLPGGVPDADDTSGALVALEYLCESDEERRSMVPAAEAGITWLLDLQNRDGGMPTFCRGWGTLPFDRSTPEITAHALRAWRAWLPYVDEILQERVKAAEQKGLAYLRKMLWRVYKHGTGYLSPYRDQVMNRTKLRLRLASLGWWQPLWFGNEHTPAENNPVFGTALVLTGLLHAGLCLEDGVDADMDVDEAVNATDTAGAAELQEETPATSTGSLQRHVMWLVNQQRRDGAWGGDMAIVPSIEETAVVVQVLCMALGNKLVVLNEEHRAAVCLAAENGVAWLLEETQQGSVFPASPIGLYFARLWYHEMIYPVVWTLGALRAARVALAESK